MSDELESSGHGRTVKVILLAAIAFTAVVAAGLWWAEYTRDSEIRGPVRAYLKANLNDPDFEEVFWGPAIIAPEGGWKITLQYRARNQFNAWVLITDSFLVNKSGVSVRD